MYLQAYFSAPERVLESFPQEPLSAQTQNRNGIRLGRVEDAEGQERRVSSDLQMAQGRIFDYTDPRHEEDLERNK